MTAAYSLTATGVRRTRDGASIQNDPANRDWQEYQAWLGAGGVPDPAPSVDLATEKARAVQVIEAQYLTRAEAAVPHARARGFSDLLLVREVDRIEGDLSPGSSDYPMLDAMVPAQGADVQAVANALRVELDAAATALAPLEAIRRAGVAAVNAAADSNAVAAALGAVVWP